MEVPPALVLLLLWASSQVICPHPRGPFLLAPHATVLVELQGLEEVLSCQLIHPTVPDPVRGTAAVAQLPESLVLFPQLSTVIWGCPQDSLCDICPFAKPASTK